MLRALERGERPVDIARRLEVSRIWVYQVKGRFKTSGERCSRPIGGHRVSHLAREQWRQGQRQQSREQLVFLDETGVTTSMTRRYGRAPKGERCVDHAPRGHRHNNTFIAALRSDRVEAPWLLDSPMNGEAFLHYVQEVLGPTLQTGDIVVADNLMPSPKRF